MKYICSVPFQDDMGSILPFVATSSPMESRSENALWTVNHMRDHDNLKPLKRLPNGTTFKIKD